MSRVAAGQSLTVNQLVDMEWKFGGIYIIIFTTEPRFLGNKQGLYAIFYFPWGKTFGMRIFYFPQGGT